MKIIVGHSHMDLDSLGSLVLAQQLYPSHKAIRNRLCHPIALNVYNIYRDHLQFALTDTLKGQTVEHMVVVDTSASKRIKEVFDLVHDPIDKIEIYDHHAEKSDIPNAIVYKHQNGANTTYLALQLMEKGIVVSPEMATIALTGIYADTGSFTHEGVTANDLKAAAWLIECGASISLVNRFLKLPAENELEKIAKEAFSVSKNHLILGHNIKMFYLELPRQISGLSSIVERIFQIDSTDAILGCIGFLRNKQTLIIGRSAKRSIDINKILQPFGGGGHALSASATLKKRLGEDILEELEFMLKTMVAPEQTAGNLMDCSLPYVNKEWDLYRTSRFLEDVRQSGLPVVDDQNKFVGNISLRNISVARKNENMKAPVKGYMEFDVPFCYPFTPVNEVENIFFTEAIGRLPVLAMDQTILGVITRERYLEFLKQNKN